MDPKPRTFRTYWYCSELEPMLFFQRLEVYEAIKLEAKKAYAAGRRHEKLNREKE